MQTIKKILTLILFMAACINSFSQDKSFRPTYVYEGFITTEKDKKLVVNMNFLVLLDSTLVGSYYYTPENGSLDLVGKLYADNTFSLTERDKNEQVTGQFTGKLSYDHKTATGKWTSALSLKQKYFELNLVKNRSYWDFIGKNRALYEYTNLTSAIKESAKVMSVDVAHQNLSSLPSNIINLKKIVSINLLGNQFTLFPKQLGKLTSLDEISMSSNKLELVGPEIGKLINLRILIMNNNRLKHLPKQLGNLKKLLYLELGNNQLTSLPTEIKYLSSLQELHIERNKLNESEKRKIKAALPNCVIHF